MADPFRLLSQPKQVQDYDKVRMAISDLMSSEKAEEFDDGAHAALAEHGKIGELRNCCKRCLTFGCENIKWCI